MDLMKLILFCILLLISGIQIGLVYRIYGKNQKRFLLYYLYYLIFIHLFLILNLVGRHFIDQILRTSDSSSVSMISIGLTMNFIAYPLLILAVFMLILFSFGLTNRRLPKVVWGVYLTVSVLGLLFFIQLLIETSERGISDWQSVDRQWGVILGNLMIVLFIIFALVQMVFYNQRIVDKSLRYSVKRFGILYLGVYGFCFLYFYFLARMIGINFYLFYILVFSMNLPSVLYLYFKIAGPLAKADREVDLRRQTLFKKFGITPSEAEIVQLIEAGKSNREISDIKFVSLQTVKNAISVIYRKVDAKSRTDLIRFIREGE